MAGYVTCSDYVAKVTYFSENYATRKNNGQGDALREVGREKPVSNNTKPTPVKVVASEKYLAHCGRGTMNLPLTVNSHVHFAANAARFSTDSDTKIINKK